MSLNYNSEFTDMKKLVDAAYECGKAIDMPNCVYGNNKVVPSYYYFLAGMCRLKSLARVLEIGTFKGGSALAMYYGQISSDDNKTKIVTVDIEARDTHQIDNILEIKKIIGDPLNGVTLNIIINEFGRQPIDLLFLDSTKKGRIVMSQLATFCLFLRPRFIILDDITLNDNMERMWNNLEVQFSKFALNLAKSHPEIRKMAEINEKVIRHPGFGIIDYEAYQAGLRSK